MVYLNNSVGENANKEVSYEDESYDKERVPLGEETHGGKCLYQLYQFTGVFRDIG